MNRKISIFFYGLLVAIPLLFLSFTFQPVGFIIQVAKNTHATPRWLPYSSKKGKFSIEFPGKPVLNETRLYNRDFGNIILYTASCDPDINHSFAVSYSDYPKSYIRKFDPIELMETARLNALANCDIQNDTTVEFNNYKGMRCTAYNLSGKTTNYYLIVLVGNRLYQVLAVADYEETEMYDYNRFIKSFSINK
ncbi:MAG: hypothetical protein CVU11_13630 [Bacteroidetes bacterium HGW-Bacteroidetes-6]|jgi:hypothetical protein|nr:MAG: hypothetical protein CVU11_13630 [Bacteroidetes bacterium HGW-Bacteroidetes-6]